MSLVNPDEGEGVSDRLAQGDVQSSSRVIESSGLSRGQRMRLIGGSLILLISLLGPCCSAGVDIHLGTPTPEGQGRAVAVGTPTPPPSQVMVPMSP